MPSWAISSRAALMTASRCCSGARPSSAPCSSSSMSSSWRRIFAASAWTLTRGRPGSRAAGQPWAGCLPQAPPPRAGVRQVGCRPGACPQRGWPRGCPEAEAARRAIRLRPSGAQEAGCAGTGRRDAGGRRSPRTARGAPDAVRARRGLPPPSRRRRRAPAERAAFVIARCLSVSSGSSAMVHHLVGAKRFS